MSIFQKNKSRRIGLGRSVVRRIAVAICLVSLSVTGTTVLAADGEDEYVVIKAGRVITVSGEEFSPGTIVIENGKVSLVGGDLEYPASAKIIRAPKETVMPGLIHPQSRYGLSHYKRTGIHGDMNAASDVYPELIDFANLLEAGFTTVCYVPAGAGIPGVATTFRTAGTEDSRVFDEFTYLQVAPKWRGVGKKMLRDALKKAKEEIDKVEKAREEWEEKQKEKEKNTEDDAEDEVESEEDGDENDADTRRSSSKQVNPKSDDEDGEEESEPAKNGDKKSEEESDEFKPPKIEPKYQPLVDLIQKKEGARMMVSLGSAADLLHLDDVLKPYEEIQHVLKLNNRRTRTDFNYVVEKLGTRESMVVVAPTLNYLPQSTNRYNLPAALVDAGCRIVVTPNSDRRSDLIGFREQLMSLVRAGLVRDEAIKAITLNAAEAIGLGARLGSIEKDKDADLVFLDGDPLDPLAKVSRVMILGEIVWKADEK